MRRLKEMKKEPMPRSPVGQLSDSEEFSTPEFSDHEITMPSGGTAYSIPSWQSAYYGKPYCESESKIADQTLADILKETGKKDLSVLSSEQRIVLYKRFAKNLKYNDPRNLDHTI